MHFSFHKEITIKASRKTLLLFLTAYLFQSCVLTNSQVRIARQYYSNLNQVETYCNTLRHAECQVEYERRQLYPESYSKDSLMVEELINNFQNYKIQSSKQDSFSIYVSKLGTYLNSCSVILPRKSSVTPVKDRRVLVAIEDYSSYLPFGIGLTIYKTIYDIVNYSVSLVRIPHTRKKMKEYILHGQEFLPSSNTFITKELNVILNHLENEKILIRQNYLKLITDQAGNTPMDFYQVYNPIFLKKYNLAFTSKELASDLSSIIPEITRTYASLNAEMQKRKRIKKEMSGMSELNCLIAKSKKHFDSVSSSLLENKVQ